MATATAMSISTTIIPRHKIQNLRRRNGSTLLLRRLFFIISVKMEVRKAGKADRPPFYIEGKSKGKIKNMAL